MSVDEHHNPWKTLATKNVYENPWIRVREDQVVRPDGKPGIYGVIHFKNRAVAILPIENDFIYLVGQYRYTIGKYFWEIPEGGCHEGEEPLAAAKRELIEETGLRAKSWTLLGEAYTSNSLTDEHAYWFLAQNLSQGERAPEGTEQLTIKKLPLAEAFEMAETGKITDGLSLMALLHYQAWQKKLAH